MSYLDVQIFHGSQLIGERRYQLVPMIGDDIELTIPSGMVRWKVARRVFFDKKTGFLGNLEPYGVRLYVE